MLYDSDGEYGKARPLPQALAIRKKVLGGFHPDYATNLNNLANLYHEMGEYTKAELLHRQAPRRSGRRSSESSIPITPKA